LRIEIPILKTLKNKIRAALGIKKKKRFSRVSKLRGVKLEKVDPDSLHFTLPQGLPKVSVIVPCYGQVDYTLNCLASIAASPPRHPIEIIVAEDASNDPRITELRRIAGIKLIENPQNLGFLRSCNFAASKASGEYLYFLNNDTIVAEGAIDALVDFADLHPEGGLIGSRLLFADGRQQEAGGIVWNDASAWLYGRNDDPMAPEYQYVREVDYVSGASILIPRGVWNQLKGFDEIYSPAYYEDTDFAFRVRGMGKKVYFQPSSNIYHFEGISHGVDVKVGVKAHQLVNMKTMKARWDERLKLENYAPEQNFFRARERAMGRKIMLVVDQYAPEPDRDAGSRNMIEFMKSLQMDGWIVKFWPHNVNRHPIYSPQLQQMGVEQFYGPYETDFSDWLTRNGGEIDFVLLARPEVALEFIDDVRRLTKAPILYYGHDLHCVRERREALVTSNPAILEKSELTEKIERDIWRRVDAVLYPSQEEAEDVRRMAPEVSSFAAPIYCFETFKRRVAATTGKQILFVAGFNHRPNVDAAIWFVEKVFPLVQSQCPRASLSLVGSSPKPEVLALARPGIEVSGWVSSEALNQYYESARVAVVPLRFGAGVKLKVVEAFVEGVPLVTTPTGVQGLPDVAGVCMIEEAPEGFASAVVRWLESSDDEWLEASLRQGDYAVLQFSRARQIEALRASVEAAQANYVSRNI
jgi:O-antigen biosynthesis protein